MGIITLQSGLTTGCVVQNFDVSFFYGAKALTSYLQLSDYSNDYFLLPRPDLYIQSSNVTVVLYSSFDGEIVTNAPTW